MKKLSIQDIWIRVILFFAPYASFGSYGIFNYFSHTYKPMPLIGTETPKTRARDTVYCMNNINDFLRIREFIDK